VRYLDQWLRHHVAWAVLFAGAFGVGLATLAKKGLVESLWLLFLTGVPIAFALYVLRAGGDNDSAFPFWRHMLHVAPILALALAAGLVILLPSWRWVRLGLLVATMLFTNYQILQAHNSRMLRHARASLPHFPDLTHAPYNGFVLFVAKIADSDTVIANGASGELPFVVDAVHIDTLGLNDYHIARYGTYDLQGPIDSKTDMAFVFEKRPDILQGPFRGSTLTPGWRRKQATEILDNPIFQTEYLFLVNGPYDARDRALFLHRSFWENHSLRQDLRSVPVTRTKLYQQGRRRRGR
jgi:hypothetical protein